MPVKGSSSGALHVVPSFDRRKILIDYDPECVAAIDGHPNDTRILLLVNVVSFRTTGAASARYQTLCDAARKFWSE
jgi:hypothetical protein